MCYSMYSSCEMTSFSKAQIKYYFKQSIYINASLEYLIYCTNLCVLNHVSFVCCTLCLKLFMLSYYKQSCYAYSNEVFPSHVDQHSTLALWNTDFPRGAVLPQLLWETANKSGQQGNILAIASSNPAFILAQYLRMGEYNHTNFYHHFIHSIFYCIVSVLL